MKKIVLFLLIFPSFSFGEAGVHCDSNCSAQAILKPEMMINCPLVKLKGKLLQHIFAGPPEYESIENGDRPETRWILEVDLGTIDFLFSIADTIPENFRPILPDDKHGNDWIQLIPDAEFEQEFEGLKNNQVWLDGFLGSWPVHCHTLFMLEVTKVNGK